MTSDELIVAVTLALDGGAASRCLAADTNRDADITVDELVAAVDSALGGCGSTR